MPCVPLRMPGADAAASAGMRPDCVPALAGCFCAALAAARGAEAAMPGVAAGEDAPLIGRGVRGAVCAAALVAANVSKPPKVKEMAWAS
jgi:hypothetical protein